MSNWFKKSWNNGIPLMDDYTNGIRPPSSQYKKDPRSLVTPGESFYAGGNKRDGYPEGTSGHDDHEKSDYEKIYQHLDGGNPIMNQDPIASGEGVNKEEFVDYPDKKPKGESIRLDNVAVGPHNMQVGLFNKLKGKMNIKEPKLN